MENTGIKLDGNVGDLIAQLQKIFDTNGITENWGSNNDTKIPNSFVLKVGGYFDGINHLHKVEIIITPSKK
jgi:hypothetical protein